jgi:hypothetical protein
LHIVKYIHKFHNYPIIETLCSTLKPTQKNNNNNREFSGNAILQENSSQEQHSSNKISGNASNTIPPIEGNENKSKN